MNEIDVVIEEMRDNAKATNSNIMRYFVGRMKDARSKEKGIDELLHEINVGELRFAWLPVRTHAANGQLATGWVWRKLYRRVRCIGFPRYYNMRIAP